MRLPWRKTNSQQLDLLGDVPMDDSVSSAQEVGALPGTRSTKGRPATVPIESIDEDPANPRAEFSDVELDDLAEDIRLRGILVPLVVHPASAKGRHLLHFGARRLRAAMRAGLHEVPVVVRDAPADRYAQVAENLKRADLAPLDLAHFIRQQMDAGDSQAEVSRRLGMNLTTVAHHLSLLDLPAGAGRRDEVRALYFAAHVARVEQAQRTAAGRAAVVDRRGGADHARRRGHPSQSGYSLRSLADDPVARSGPRRLRAAWSACWCASSRPPMLSRWPPWSPCGQGSPPCLSTCRRGLTVRPPRGPNPEPLECGVKELERSGWQDRLAASEPMHARCRAAESCDGRFRG